MNRICMVALVIALAAAACVQRGKRFENLDATLKGNEVSRPVSIVYDRSGVPHIIAENDQDLFYGLGYAMAQDRFYFMDLARHIGQGRLCRMFGRPARYGSYDVLTMDRLVRSFQFEKRAREGAAGLDPRTRAILESYASGVNRYLKDAGHKLPEYRALGIRPEPWKVEDSFVCMDMYGLSMTLFGLFYEYYGDRLVREVGPERARIFMPEYPGDAPYITQDRIPLARNSEAIEQVLGMFEDFGILFSGIGSNNWVADGTMAAGGKPILANDPHVPHPIVPTFWYHAHLMGGSYNAVGLMFAGIPLMGSGTNGRVAWGITNARCDYIDLFREKINPDDPNQYLYKGQWRDFETVRETIPVKGGLNFKHRYRRSVHGALIEKDLGGVDVPVTGGEVLAIHLMEVDFPKFMAGYLDIPRSRDAASLYRAVEGMSMGPVAWNTVYATVDGDIGYLYSGHVPIRPDGQGVLPRPGTGEADWAGLLDFDDLPHARNPSKHFIVTANNKVEPPGYPHYLSAGYNIPSRAARITELLQGRRGLTVEDMGKIQMDVRVKSAERFVPIILGDLEGVGDPAARRCRKALEQWERQGYNADLDSGGASVYKLLMKEMGKLTFADELTPKLVSHLGMAEMVTHALWHVLEEPESEWFDDVSTPGRESRRDVVHAAAVRADEYLVGRFGDDPGVWRWGGLQKIHIRTPLGYMPWNKKERIGSFPLGGTEETVNNATSVFIGGKIGYMAVAGPSSRIVVDMADPERLHFNATAGNSENPDSPMFDIPTDEWLSGKYLVVSMRPEDFREGAIGELRLEP